jgi:hypothetical protein
MMPPLTREALTITFGAAIRSWQFTVFFSMTALAVAMRHGPV